MFKRVGMSAETLLIERVRPKKFPAMISQSANTPLAFSPRWFIYRRNMDGVFYMLPTN